ncbi:MAG: YhcH/YjgK/YiaL family protein [Fermentimonas sp.]|nr:YhcH/YjgK/YiaL family protein [Fermentimonas sp.]HBT85449.1 YhcH/YjgK/YiaL family protein [Porphyromonadaceae bacterium]MDD2931478.1 YhcH/YjgK/YiaL family protein [Fermentimonas sp.]MDD3189344.1 YhcH/YjgK/YiaL family protein [Fermentimonas sp.]MDD4285298.1 YhcH/YjgK/YiaL family protein [Fermentimonas sp.]
MIVDKITNSSNYFGLNPLFKEAFEYINQIDVHTAETGTVELVCDRLRVSVVETKMKSLDEAKLETHKKFIDIQIPISRSEKFGWKSQTTLKLSESGYNDSNDIEFYKDKPSTYVDIMPGEFVIFFPEDGHAPLIGEGETKKIIIKVAIPNARHY